jgi:hypothetical protein
MSDPLEAHTAHRRTAEIVRALHDRPEPDSDTVIAELAEHAANASTPPRRRIATHWCSTRFSSGTRKPRA